MRERARALAPVSLYLCVYSFECDFSFKVANNINVYALINDNGVAYFVDATAVKNGMVCCRFDTTTRIVDENIINGTDPALESLFDTLFAECDFSRFTQLMPLISLFFVFFVF